MLQLAADEYIRMVEHNGEVRFDIISIVADKNRTEITHFEDAFWPEY